ncbi:MAG: mercuric transporter MerT family protein [Candidatus Brocadiales bacterium]
MRDKFLAGGGILAAVLASFCCIGPLILAAIGMSGASFIAPVAKYRPIFIGFTFALIGAAYYFTYWRKDKACCLEERPRRRWAQEISLWAITAVAVGLAAFPYAWGHFGGGDTGKAIVQNDLKIVTLKVEGMTCASCAKTVKSAISEVRGVKAVRVDLKSGEVRVGFEKGASLTFPSELLAVLEKKGYKGAVDVNSSGKR